MHYGSLDLREFYRMPFHNLSKTTLSLSAISKYWEFREYLEHFETFLKNLVHNLEELREHNAIKASIFFTCIGKEEKQKR